MMIKRSFTFVELDAVSIGDSVEDEYGKKGIIEKIDILKRFNMISYYFILSKSNGTILILK
ncbi:hypothetical protein [Pedobacter paludis]|uniref:PRC-barrel domain-containing protein n=1 Tax=Pedobacter paludis TaxID=2203212 RepID=A0A317ETD0_9SPHI|nr:hypothetical protein [Pedobacter paludis]PWS29682.1 hypothetical protein DF947_21795 [Pedobacter paludis]